MGSCSSPLLPCCFLPSLQTSHHLAGSNPSKLAQQSISPPIPASDWLSQHLFAKSISAQIAAAEQNLSALNISRSHAQQNDAQRKEEKCDGLLGCYSDVLFGTDDRLLSTEENRTTRRAKRSRYSQDDRCPRGGNCVREGFWERVRPYWVPGHRRDQQTKRFCRGWSCLSSGLCRWISLSSLTVLKWEVVQLYFCWLGLKLLFIVPQLLKVILMLPFRLAQRKNTWCRCQRSVVETHGALPAVWWGPDEVQSSGTRSFTLCSRTR